MIIKELKSRGLVKEGTCCLPDRPRDAVGIRDAGEV